MIISAIWNPKGGCGKSTLTINLASAVHKTGKKALVIDKDIQGSLGDLKEAGKVHFDVLREMPNDRPAVDFIFVDYPAQHFSSLIYGEKFVITPVLPCRMDFRVFFKSLSHVKDAKNLLVVNKVDFRLQEHRNIAMTMKGRGASIIRQRSAYERANGLDSNIFDPACDSINNISHARAEINSLLNTLVEKTKTKAAA